MLIESCCHKLDLKMKLLEEYRKRLGGVAERLAGSTKPSRQHSAIVSGTIGADGVRVLVSESETQRAARLACEVHASIVH